MAKLIAGLMVVFLGLAIAVIAALIYGAIFMVLWNYVAPVYWSAAPQITLLQAVATTALIGCLTGPAKAGSGVKSK